MTEAIYLEVTEKAEAARKAKRRVSVSGMLKILGVSRSGYRAWLKHVSSNAEKRQESVKAKIKDIYDKSKQNYGAPKITQVLRKTGESNLPIDKAILLSKKYHYSLDWIYDTPGTQNQHNSKQNYLEQSDKFLVDIRDFISFSDNAFHFVIPDNCRKYVHELSSILFSSKTNSEKKRLRAELDGKYSKSNKGDVVWRISIPSDKLCSYLHFDSSFIPFIDKENDLEYEPTEKQVADAISFLNELFQ